MKDAYILDLVRTPRGRGKVNGSLHEVKPITLFSTVLKALKERNHLPTEYVDDIILGCVTPVGEQGGNIAKAAALYSDWDERVAGLQLNRLCGSSLEAINLAAMKIRSGWENLVVAGGVESMSRVAMGSDGGPLMFDPAVNAKVNYIPQGVSADLVATLNGYTREDLDQYALRSIQRATKAMSDGLFDASMVPVFDMNQLVVLDKEEHLRSDSTLEGLSVLPAAFEIQGATGFDDMAIMKYPFLEKINHLHTAGNSSGIVDGASAILIGSADIAKQLNLKPRAKIIAASVVGSEPTIMLDGTIPSTKKALSLVGMKASDIDLWEANEAFAAPVLHFIDHYGLDIDNVNVNGGAISMGHPLGATGGMLMVNLVDELERRSLSTGMVTMCMAGGMGVSTIIELC